MRMDMVASSLSSSADAKRMHQECLDLCESIIGPHHPDTLTVKCNLARSCRDDDDYDRADILHRECWEACRDRLGDQHPDTIDSLEQMALVALDKTDYARARSLYDSALQLRRLVHGENVRSLFCFFSAMHHWLLQHPRTISCLRLLADVMYESGDLSVCLLLLTALALNSQHSE